MELLNGMLAGGVGSFLYLVRPVGGYVTLWQKQLFMRATRLGLVPVTRLVPGCNG